MSDSANVFANLKPLVKESYGSKPAGMHVRPGGHEKFSILKQKLKDFKRKVLKNNVK